MRSKLQRNMLVAAVGCCAIAILIIYFGAGKPRVSDQGYQTLMALFSATNRKDEKSIDLIVGQMQESLDRGLLPKRDYDLIDRIVGLAKDKQWQQANAKARALMEAQVTKAK